VNPMLKKLFQTSFIKNLLCLGLAAVGLVIATNACTSLVAGDAKQCSSNAECSARGPDFLGTTCNVALGLCEAPVGTKFYTGNECTQNTDCASRGVNFICSERGNRCIEWKNAECQRIIGVEPEKPVPNGTVLLGLMSQITKNENGYFREGWHYEGAALALKHFRGSRASVLNDGRNVAIVACGQGRPRGTAAHLAELGVKAVVGPSQESKLRGVAETLIPAGVPVLTGWANGNPAAVLEGSDKLIRTTSFDRSEVLAPLSAALAIAQKRFPTEPKIRVAVLIGGTGGAGPLANYEPFVDQGLRYNNDIPAIQQAEYYKRWYVGLQPVSEQLVTANEIKAFKPHVIIPIVDIEWGGGYLDAIETAVSTLAQKPIYLHPFLQLEDQGYRNASFAGDAAFASRVFGIRPLHDVASDAFYKEFSTEFGKPAYGSVSGNPTPPPGAARAYETTLLALYASFAAAQKERDFQPSEIIAALAKITDSKAETKVSAVPDGPERLGIPALLAGRTIKLTGLFTQFDYAANETHPRAVWELWCTTPALGEYLSGKIYDPKDLSKPFIQNPERTVDNCGL
jgi:hypothetical protein